MLAFYVELTGYVPVWLVLLVGFLFVLGVRAVWAQRSQQRTPIPVLNRAPIARVTYGQSTDVRRRADFLTQEDESRRHEEH